MKLKLFALSAAVLLANEAVAQAPAPDAAYAYADPSGGAFAEPSPVEQAWPSSSAALSAEPTTSAPDAASAGAISDPWEGFNRRMFSVHKGLDRAVVGPVARGYKAVTPRPVRKGVGNFVDNLGEPVTFVNDVLQLKPKRAGKTVGRFVINTTVGVLGVFDVAGNAGLPRESEDFGQTLGRYGAEPGPYVFIPVLGPSSVRDVGGRVVDGFINPLNTVDFENATEIRAGVYVGGAVNTRAELDPQIRQLEATATDEYATYRSLYAQRRRAEVADGEATAVEDLPDFGDPAPARPAPQRPRPRRQ